MPSYQISKEFSFDAAHILHGLPEGHKCGRLHGHTYTVIFHLSSDHLNSVGFVRDYGELKPVKDYIDQELDHRNLNDVLSINTTAENIAKFLFDKFAGEYPELYAVTVKETPKTTAKYIGR